MTNVFRDFGWSINRDLIELYRMSGHGSGTPITIRGTSPLTLANALAKKLKSLVQFGKVSVSDGVITCNNGTLSVVDGEIVTTGTAEEVMVTGENLFDKDTATFVNGSLISADGTISANASYAYCSDYMLVAPSTSYSFSGDGIF